MQLTVYEIDDSGHVTDKGRVFHTLPHLTPKLRRDLMSLATRVLGDMSRETVEQFRACSFESDDILKLIASYFKWLMENGYEMDVVATLLIEDGKKFKDRTLEDIQEVKQFLDVNLPDGKTPEVIANFIAQLEDQQILEAYNYGWQTMTQKVAEALDLLPAGKLSETT